MTPLERSREIATAVRAAGGRAFVVGGWVRDRLMGRESKDIDIEVYGIPADRLRPLLEAFGRVESVGASFQVYKVDDIDVSLPRHESKSGRGQSSHRRKSSIRTFTALRRIAILPMLRFARRASYSRRTSGWRQM